MLEGYLTRAFGVEKIYEVQGPIPSVIIEFDSEESAKQAVWRVDSLARDDISHVALGEKVRQFSANLEGAEPLPLNAPQAIISKLLEIMLQVNTPRYIEVKTISRNDLG
jgi:hypothetical protein